MARDTKMLQLLLNGQAAIRQDMQKGFAEVTKRFDKTDKRIDNLGLQIARLEDSAPDMEEFIDLEQKVKDIQQHLALN